MIQVVEHENRRKGAMTHMETKQCVNDLLSWLKRNNYTDYNDKAKSADIQQFEKRIDGTIRIPETLGELIVCKYCVL